jgi:hypothetical protein
MRHRWEAAHPVDVAASSGLLSDGTVDMLYAALLLVPTMFLIRLAARHETIYLWFSRCLLALSLTAPLFLLLLYTNRSLISDLCLQRLVLSPLFLIIIGGSRLMAQFDSVRRQLMVAFLIETVAAFVALGFALGSFRI